LQFTSIFNLNGAHACVSHNVGLTPDRKLETAEGQLRRSLQIPFSVFVDPSSIAHGPPTGYNKKEEKCD